jgi:serine/threonine-protein kinase OSR1/STK39
LVYLFKHKSCWCRGCFDVYEDDMDATSPCWKDVVQSDSDLSKKVVDQEAGRDDGENPGQNSLLPRTAIPGHKKILSGSLMQDNILSPKKVTGDADRYVCLYMLI